MKLNNIYGILNQETIISEGFRIETASHDIDELFQLRVSFESGAFIYRERDSDDDIIRVGKSAKEKERVQLKTYNDIDNRLKTSEVTVVYPFDINPYFTGAPLVKLIEKFEQIITSHGNAKYVEWAKAKEIIKRNGGKETIPPVYRLAIGNTFANMRAISSKEADDVLSMIKKFEAHPETANKVSVGMSMTEFISMLSSGIFAAYVKNAGICIAQRIKHPRSSEDIKTADKFVELCGIAMRNHNMAQQRQTQGVKGSDNQYDYIIAPESTRDAGSETFNEKLFRSMKQYASTCSRAEFITIPKTVDRGKITPPQSELELKQRRDNMSRARHAVVNYRTCPKCGFRYGLDKINRNVELIAGKPATNVYYSPSKDYKANSQELRSIGKSQGYHCGAPVDNDGQYTKSTSAKWCQVVPQTLEDLLTFSPSDEPIDGITFLSLTKRDRADRKESEDAGTFETWDELTNHWVKNEIRKIRTITRGTGIPVIKNIPHDKRRFAKIYGAPEDHIEQLDRIANKKCLIIDDNIAGGSTIELIEQILQAYGPSLIDAFVPLRLVPS